MGETHDSPYDASLSGDSTFTELRQISLQASTVGGGSSVRFAEEHEILFGDDPNQAYFAYMMKDQRTSHDETYEEVMTGMKKHGPDPPVAAMGNIEYAQYGQQDQIQAVPPMNMVPLTQENIQAVQAAQKKDVPSVIFLGGRSGAHVSRKGDFDGTTSIGLSTWFEQQRTRRLLVILLALLILVIIAFATAFLAIALTARKRGGIGGSSVNRQSFSSPAPTPLTSLISIADGDDEPFPTPTAVNEPNPGGNGLPTPLSAPSSPTAPASPVAIVTKSPTKSPTFAPTASPTAGPTPVPTSPPTSAPTTATPTFQPVPGATPMPSKTPTLPPTSFPTPFPTPPPTSFPTPVPTPSPTLPPTPLPTVTPRYSISVSDALYVQGETIRVEFLNSPPRNDDWIGIFPAGASLLTNENFVVWVYACGSRGCSEPITEGSVHFLGQSTGNWPIPPGDYRAHLLLNTEPVPGYTAYATSSVFTVVSSPTPAPAPPSPAPARVAQAGAFETFIAFLSSESFDAGDALSDPNSPQFRAAEWIYNDPQLDLYSTEKVLTRYGLATFFLSTNGDSWTQKFGWMTYTDECTWYTSQSQPSCISGIFRRLNLRANNVGGTLPSELALVDTLQRINLTANSINGNVPAELGSIPGLSQINFNSNNFDGVVPVDLCELDFSVLRMDCCEVTCACCTRCCKDGSRVCWNPRQSSGPGCA